MKYNSFWVNYKWAVIHNLIVILEVNLNYNHGHNILKFFDVLPDFPLTTSETKRDS